MGNLLNTRKTELIVLTSVGIPLVTVFGYLAYRWRRRFSAHRGHFRHASDGAVVTCRVVYRTTIPEHELRVQLKCEQDGQLIQWIWDSAHEADAAPRGLKAAASRVSSRSNRSR